ncbi:MAG: nucleotidyl transferase AbiEii/AbiGii toxin family protein [Cyclobacteriaceae bacterium]|nr:nucleotidyl transferase AbiEii/AbiGii toxin family protein [Cyclobacteriaceae bacterium]
MLHKTSSIISPKTFSLIQELQHLPELKKFYLVGGTALALQLGHRNSVDIDLFTQDDFTQEDILNLLKPKYTVREIFQRTNTIIVLVNNVKTDFIKHDYPFIRPPVTEEGITFLSKEDIAAMKFHAIIQSGKRLKDFIDIYFLLEHFSMKQMVDFFSAKYTYSNPMIALKAVNFFDEIDESIDPPKLLKPLKIDQVKKRIREATQKPLKVF